ncbi:MAG: hypothetical protein DI533_00255 [Cereibacter sphaeroides]|uniref:Uncharacterized protein n=1 Tax=Cereibacter sphaeroides TaxID=1063 RepID=A0A2W5SIP0_CERSP|nr:MAG: hypothetical protein DI533_00255 [Cereibacter sphaeroides]
MDDSWKGEYLIRAPKREWVEPPKSEFAIRVEQKRNADWARISPLMKTYSAAQISQITGIGYSRIYDLAKFFGKKFAVTASDLVKRRKEGGRL